MPPLLCHTFWMFPYTTPRLFFRVKATTSFSNSQKNATWGHKAQARNHQNSTLLCLSFLDWLRCSVTPTFSSMYAFFEGILRHLGEYLHQFTQGGGQGPKAL